jgi:SulP family sulfate permease
MSFMLATPARRTGTDRLVGDVWGGLAAALVALPSSIAYGIAGYAPLGAGHVGQGAMAGLLGAMALGLVASLAGGTPRLISAPCAPAAAVMAGLVGQLLPGAGPGHALVLVTLVGLLSGVLQIIYGAVGGGRLIKYIPFPVVSGYLSAVGILILLGQLPRLFGLPKEVSTWAGMVTPALWLWPGLVVGGVTILVMLIAPRLTRAVPAPILGLAAGMLTYGALAWPQPALRELSGNPLLVGPVTVSGAGFVAALSGRWAELTRVRLVELLPLVAPALTLSVLLAIDTLKTCLVVDALTRSRHGSNRELVGQGLANLAAALVGGMPGSGTMGPTLVNLSSGGKSRLSGVLEGVFVIGAALLVGRLIGWVPIGALAGILILVALRMIDWHSLLLIRQRSTVLDFVVIAAVVVVAVRFNLIAAAGAGLSLAILLFIREEVRGSVIRRKVYGHQVSSKQHRLPAEKEVLQQDGALTAVCELQGSLFFGTTDQLFTELEKDIRTCRHLVLDMRRVRSVDFSAVHVLEQIDSTLAERGGHLIFTNLPATLPSGQYLQAYFRLLGVSRPALQVKIFDTLEDALEWTEERTLEAARVSSQQAEVALELAQIDLLRELEADALAALRLCAEERAYEAGQTIFRAGDAGDELFLIRRGRVRIVVATEAGRPLCLAIFGRGNFFGDMAFLDRGARSADALAIDRAELYAISRARFDEMSRAHPLVGVKVFARLARALAVRLRYTDNELRALQDA